MAVNYKLPGNAASYNIAADSQGDVWFATVSPTALYEITPGGTINGPYLSELMDHPTGVAIDTNNNVYITDDTTERLLEYTSAGVEKDSVFWRTVAQTAASSMAAITST